ncbi:MAG: GNAT family N-acetyltransferase [Candidatus Spyradocola sp.]
MEYAFVSSDRRALAPLIAEFFGTLGSLGSGTDGFFDDHIWSAALHEIRRGGEVCGFVAEKDGLLAAFYLRQEWLRDGRAVLEQAVAQFGLERAFVTSGDAAMVSLCMERAVLNGKKIELQAYNFRLGEREVRPAEYDATHLRLVPPEEYGWVNALTEGEWAEDMRARDDLQVWALEDGGQALGFGLVCPHRLRPEIRDIGNYVRPEHRRKGVGRSVIMGLTRRVLDAGLVPSVGCWYYNAESYLTLTSAGYLPVTRIFNVAL